MKTDLIIKIRFKPVLEKLEYGYAIDEILDVFGSYSKTITSKNVVSNVTYIIDHMIGVLKRINIETPVKLVHRIIDLVNIIIKNLYDILEKYKIY